MKGSKIPIIFSFLFLIIFTVPIAYLIFGSSFFQVAGSTLTWETFVQVMTSPRTGQLILNTVVFAVGGAILAVALATTYSWILVRTDTPGKRILELLPILPLTMPFLVKAFAWIYLFSPRIGLVNLFLNLQLGLPPFFNIYTMGGMIFAIGVGGMPLAYLTVDPAIKSMNPALEEASRVAGNGILKTILKVTVPVLLPAILSAFLLLTIIGLENFDYPFMLGNIGGVNTLATEVYFWINDSLPPRFGTASIISMIYLVITMAALAVYIYVTRRTYKFVVVTGKATQQTVHKLHKWKYAALGLCFLIMFVAFILPFSTILLMSFTPFISVAPSGVQLSFTLQNYITMLNLPLLNSALTNTVFLGLVAGVFATLLGTFLSYAALKSKVRGARAIEIVSSLPLAFPGIVYGLALFWTFLLLPVVSDLIYGTIWALVLALIFVRLPYCVRMISGNLMQIADELEESSRVSGASWERTFYRIVLPLMGRGLINSFTYTFVNSLRELGAVVLLVTGGTQVLTVLLLNLYSQHSLALNTIAAASVLLTLLILAALIASRVLQSFLTYRKTKASTL